MPERAQPPDDISPLEFFTRWLPEVVAQDHERRARLGDTEAVLVFEVVGEEGGVFSLRITGGYVEGAHGDSATADLRIEVDVETWRRLNRGEISAPQAALLRRVKLSGNLVLALKLHVILG
jgi:putative sterol carrier protein